jgi:hypothetical protein
MKKNRVNLTLFVLLAMVVVTAGCSGCAGQKAMTDKQQGATWGGIYVSEYDNVKMVLSNPLTTPAQKDLALKKKAILTRAYPLIKDFMAPGDKANPAGPIVGYSMSADKIALLMSLIDELTALIGGV